MSNRKKKYKMHFLFDKKFTEKIRRQIQNGGTYFNKTFMKALFIL